MSVVTLLTSGSDKGVAKGEVLTEQGTRNRHRG